MLDVSKLIGHTELTNNGLPSDLFDRLIMPWKNNYYPMVISNVVLFVFLISVGLIYLLNRKFHLLNQRQVLYLFNFMFSLTAYTYFLTYFVWYLGLIISLIYCFAAYKNLCRYPKMIFDDVINANIDQLFRLGYFDVVILSQTKIRNFLSIPLEERKLMLKEWAGEMNPFYYKLQLPILLIQPFLLLLLFIILDIGYVMFIV